MSNDNLKLWNAVEKTDPAFTKEFNRGGGFKGTAINPTYLAKKATEQFGPLGIGWGWDIVQEEMMVGAPIAEGVNELIHCLLVKVWFKWNGERGEVQQFGATTFVGKNKYGPFTDEETKKKSLTDGVSKCLALMGFSSDVHMGRYDDSKYVNDRKAEVAEATKKAQVESLRLNEAEIKAKLEKIVSNDDVTTYWRQLGLSANHPQYNSVLALFQEAKQRISPPAAKNDVAA